MTPSVVPDPRLCRGVINCSASNNSATSGNRTLGLTQEHYHLYTASDNVFALTGAGQAGLGETIVGHVPCDQKLHVVWYFTKHDKVLNCQVYDY